MNLHFILFMIFYSLYQKGRQQKQKESSNLCEAIIIYIQNNRNSVMYQKDQYSSLAFNPNRERPQRPQTPIMGGNKISQGQFNQSYTKNSMPYSPHKLHNNVQYPNISKSRVSVSSSNSQLSFLNADQGQVFPEDLIFLLKNQEKNINNFKQKIEKQKARVQNDFAVLKTQIDHTLEDLKLSVQAKLDLVYKIFISKYAQIKGEVQQIRRVRKQILMANQVGSTQPRHGKDLSSNQDIMSEIEKDAEHFRNYRIYGYLSEMQKQKLNPILQLCNELILIGSIDSPFYRSKQMGLKHKDLKLQFQASLNEVHQRLSDYVISPEAIVQRDKQEEENSANILKNIQIQNQYNNPPQPHYQRQAFDAMYPENRPTYDSEVAEFAKKKSHLNLQFEDRNRNQAQNKRLPLLGLSKSEKSIITKWAQSCSLKKLERVVTDHSSSILCIFFIDSRYIATGSKDKTINVYTIDGKKVTTLIGHQASICSLSSITNKNNQTFLASGSDHGCCCLILWETKTWTIFKRIQSHIAAVTSIVDLDDGQNLVTGSYDKKINLYNYERGQVISSYSNKSAVTSIVITSDRKKLVSAGLDNSMQVWNIYSRAQGLSLQVEKTINMNSMICVMEASLLRPEIIVGATRDGKVKMFNINSQSETEKVFTVNQNSIIELALIQRQMNAECPLVLTCSSKDKSLCLTKMDNGLSEFIKINGACNIEFGCGIGPKIVFSGTGIMAILSQSANEREFSLFQLQLK